VTDPDLRRAMAMALLAQGGFACDDVTEHYGCGDSYFEMNPVAADATFDDGCLRRNLALWALGEIGPADARDLEAALAALVAMEEPETELQRAAFGPVGDDALLLALLAAAPPSLAEEMAIHLETDAGKLRGLAMGLDAAATGLDPRRHRRALWAAVVGGDLDAPTRLTILEDLVATPTPTVATALAALTDDDDCQVAMYAAAALAALGDPSYLPARPAGADPDAHLRALCMLAYDDDADRQDQRWRAWIGDAGVAEVWATDYPYDDYDDAGERVEPDSEPVADERRHDLPLDPRLGNGRASCAGHACHLEAMTIELVAAADGSLHIDRIETHDHGGCGC
jgi:hypothetical protein